MIIVLRISSLPGTVLVHLVKQNGKAIYLLVKQLVPIEVDDEYRILDNNEIDPNHKSRELVLKIHQQVQGGIHDPVRQRGEGHQVGIRAEQAELNLFKKWTKRRIFTDRTPISFAQVC